MPPHRGLRAARLAPAAVASLAAAVLVAACGGDGATAPPKPRTATMRIVSGGGYADTVLSPAPADLVVEVRDSTGKPAAGVVVRFESSPSPVTEPIYQSALYVCGLTVKENCAGPNYNTSYAFDTTDADGRAAVWYRLGTAATPAYVYAIAASLGLRDSAAFTVRPGNATQLWIARPDTAVRVGGTYDLGATSRDQFRNVRDDAIAYTTNGVVSVDARGVVGGVTIGRGAITATVGTLTATAAVSVVPVAHIAAYRHGGDLTPAIVEFDLDGSNFHQRVAVSGATDVRPTWAPGGADVLFTDVTGPNGLWLWRANAAGTVSSAVADPTIVTSADGQFNRNASFLYFDAATETTSGLWRAQLDGSAAVALFGTDGGHQPSPSPGATQLVFADAAGGLSIATGTGQFTGIQQLVATGSAPRWGPFGGRIAYIATSAGPGPLAVIGSDRSGQHVLVDGAFSPGVDWSPDGLWLIASRAGRLELIRFGDGLELPLSLGAEPLYDPAWKP